MNNITKIISVILLALVQATAFAYEVGDTITENGVKYFVVEKHYCGRYQVIDKILSDKKSHYYNGQVLVVGTDGATKNICVANTIRFVTKRTPSDSVYTAEQYFVMGINNEAFANLELESITIPNRLNYVGTGAFRNLKVTRGTLWMPYVDEYGEDVFSNMKADLVFLASSEKRGDTRYYTKLNHTFEPADSLPKIIVKSLTLKDYSKASGWPVDRMLCYGWNLLNEKREEEGKGIEKCGDIITRDTSGKKHSWTYNYSSFKFFTASKGVEISVKKTKIKKKEKNPYAIYNDVRDRFVTPFFYNYGNILSPSYQANDLFFRLEDNDQYVYYTLDGKKVEYSVVADKEGLDPFGTRIISEEEIEKRKAKEVNIKKLDKKTDDLMKRFGF